MNRFLRVSVVCTLFGTTAVLPACVTTSNPGGSAAGAPALSQGGQPPTSLAAAGTPPSTSGGGAMTTGGAPPILNPSGGAPPQAGTSSVGGASGGAPGENAGASAMAGAAGAAGAPGPDDLLPDPEDTETGEEPEAPATLIGDVAFSVPSQSFQGTLSVELSSTLAGEIRYTTDGSLPTATSTLYASALMLDRSTELRAQVFGEGITGLPSTALYVARDFDTTSDIPILILDGFTGGKPTDKETYRRAAFLLFEPVDGVASLANLPTVATRSGHRLRGQSSQDYPKTPYRVELWSNVEGEDADYPIAGMPAEADWALISLYVDRSLVRNAFMYELGRGIGLQAPRQAFAEVYINQDAPVVSASHYQGVYNITETIKNAKNRLNLEQLKEDDLEPQQLSGGYIVSFEYEAVEGESIDCTGDDVFSRSAPGSFTPIPVTEGFCWANLELRDPEPIHADQKAWLTQYVQQFHDSLHSEPVGPYADFIDVNSFVDYFLITELTRNMDAYIRSAYFHKERDEKLVAGPLWDFDLSLGAGGFFDNLAIAGWQVANRRVVHDWFIVLTRDPAFLELVGTRWAELRQGPLSDANLTALVDTVSTPLTAAAARDHTKWSVQSVRTAYSVIQFPAGDTWQAQVAAIKTWVLQRAAWIDGEAGNSFTVPDYPFVP